MRLKPLDYFYVGYLSMDTYFLFIVKREKKCPYFQAGLRFKMFTVIKLNCFEKICLSRTQPAPMCHSFASVRKPNYNSYFQELTSLETEQRDPRVEHASNSTS